MKENDMQKKIWLILGIVFAVFLVGFLVFTITKRIGESKEFKEQEDKYRELQVQAEGKSSQDKEEVGASEAEVKPPLGGRTYDFEALREENQDIIAWLYLPDTEIDYPVMQNEDIYYYLEHNMDGSKGKPGCLYTEYYNEPDFSDPLTIIYGHNMRNGTMFGTLKQFKEPPFFNRHTSIYLYTPDGDYEYQIIAVTLFSNEHLLAERFADDSEGNRFYEGVNGNEGVRLMERLKEYGDDHALYVGVNEQKVTEEDKLLVLSTCDRNRQKRLLVVGKLIKD